MPIWTLITQRLQGQSLLSRIVMIIVLILAVAAGFAFLAFAFGFILVLAACLAVWIMWQRWRIRRKLRQAGYDLRRPANKQTYLQADYEVIQENEPRNKT